ncbi:MAG TPA: carboxypeptidase-like regulatory domain-containing protein [Candidatus Eisenbacteria bacterium]|nr:carboxypeptidase-like regulatory domain-containing protein [Candidatus Eisenbacteria bacterium]
MAAEETKHDLWLKRINTWIAILGGSIASLAGAYNFLPAAPGEVSAVVRSQTGAPVSRAQVELTTTQNVLLGTSETDASGRYIKKDLEPGNYILKVSRSGFEPQVSMVSVASKRTTDLEVVLRNRNRAQTPAAAPAAGASQVQGDAIRAALEETGASWIKSFSRPGK